MYGNMWGGPVGPMFGMGPGIGRMGFGAFSGLGRGIGAPNVGLGAMRRGIGGGLLGRSGSLGLIGRMGNVSSSIKGINWGNLFNNASRALGVVNQTIPLVKQAGPMFSNMKSMLRLASAFKDVTDDNPKNIRNNLQKKETNIVSNSNYNHDIKKDYSNYDNLSNGYEISGNEPQFFI